MAGWSSLTTGSGLDFIETNDAYEKIGLDVDIKDVDIDANHGVFDGYEDECEVRQRCTFDQVMSLFVKQIGERGVLRPIPVVIGDNQVVDLFKLFCGVRDRGGCCWVSKNRLWLSVANELGLDCGETASVKLIYSKYLNELEKWFRERCKSRSLGNVNSQLLSLELEREFKGLLLDGAGVKAKGGEVVQLESDRSGKIEIDLSDAKDAYRMHGGDRKCNCDAARKVCSDDNNDCLVSISSLNESENDHKRKRESLSGMLKWVIEAAKQPKDPSIGEIPGPTKWKEHKGNENWAQAVRVKEALLLRRNTGSKTEESLFQKKLKTHRLMHDENSVAGQHSSERLRCSERLLNSLKSRSCACCSSSASQSYLISPHTKELDKASKKKAPAGVLATNTTVSSCDDKPREKDVSVGASFQADIPEWTGVEIESDSQWLGTRVWPLQCEEDSAFGESYLIGQGRPDLCGCRLPGSVPCHRFHIAEARMKLKRELGSVFYHWRFHHMGEEVSLQWTAEEEKRFKELVKSCFPSFWNKSSRWFPKKVRENLVSYYFNVFVVQRRSYQNRVTPKDIDSDDDETEFGSFSNGFRHEAVEVSANILQCTQNQQCTDLD